MKIAVMQPYIFPYIGYFQLIQSVVHFVSLDNVHYITKGWIERNNISINNNKHLFTLPLESKGRNKLITELKLKEFPSWKDKFSKTIIQNYKKFPHFEETMNLINTCLDFEEEKLSLFILNSLQTISNHLVLETTFSQSSELNIEETAQQRILKVCLEHKADQYHNPIGGWDIYDPSLFKEHGVNVKFIKTKDNVFKQEDSFPFDDPYISIIDILFRFGKEKTHDFLNNYDLLEK
jgi:hypothetical protein